MTYRSEVGNLETHLARIGAELDRFLEFHSGDAMQRRTDWMAALARELPRDGIGAQAVIDELAETLIPNGSRLMEPGFWGWITAGPDTVPVVTATAASVAAPQRYSITAFNLLEEVSLDWLAELSGLDRQMKGVYSSGGSVSNLVALGAARQWAFEQRGVDASANGMGAARGTIYISEEAHHTVQRSAGVLGLGRSSVRLIAIDERQRMCTDALRRAINEDLAAGLVPIAIVATAGTTNTGAIDPLRAIGEVARQHNIWYHVDGAYGLLGGLDKRLAPLYDGLELADSAIFDPHKWLGAPVGISATFVRDRSILFRAFTQEPAAYLEDIFDTTDHDIKVSVDSIGVPYSEFSVELSAPARGAVVWSIIRELGQAGVTARICFANDLARRLADNVRSRPQLELLTEPVLSICCFRYTADNVNDLNRFNETLLRRLHRETAYTPSSTRVRGAFALRPCFINARTRPEHVDGFTESVVAIGDEMLGEMMS